MGMAELRIADPMPRDRLLFLNALAILLLTLLGAAGESLGMDKDLRTSTTKRRTHSLFRQGCMWFGLIPNMPEPRLRPLLIKFGEMINQNSLLASALTAAEGSRREEIMVDLTPVPIQSVPLTQDGINTLLEKLNKDSTLGTHVQDALRENPRRALIWLFDLTPVQGRL